MKGLLLDPATERSIARTIERPPHGLLIIAPPGAGKGTLAAVIASALLGTTPDKLSLHPYFKLIAPQAGKAISIESVRTITHFLSLKPTGPNATSRVVIIEQAQALTNQAQNALLKTIEEPPEGTVLILTAPSELGLLPTIRSRVQRLPVTLPGSAELATFFGETYDKTAVQKALAVSDGLPGLTYALLSSNTEHPLVSATATARDILQRTAFERLSMTDELAKDRQLWLDTLFILARMADVSLRKSGATDATTRRWHRVLASCHEAERQTLTSAQLKLVMLNFMLNI